jgi:transposase-like protein
MGQVLHGCATTTGAIRRAIQHSQESLSSFSKRYGINPKTIAKGGTRIRRMRRVWTLRAASARVPSSDEKQELRGPVT